MKKEKILSSVLALTMVTALSVPVFAVEAETSDVNASGTESTIPVELTAEPILFSVSVPSALPVHVSADGVITVAEGTKIVNNSGGAVKISNLSLTAKGDWEMTDYDTYDHTTDVIGSKKFAIQASVLKTTGDDTTNYTDELFPILASKNEGDTDEIDFTYDVKVAAQDTTFEGEGLADLVFTLSWNEAEVEEISFRINGSIMTAEAGMTWRQWVESKYNTTDYAGLEWTPLTITNLNSTEYVGINNLMIIGATPDALITEGQDYYLQS